MDETRTDRQRRVAAVQSAYYLPTGIWPLVPFVGIRSFEVLTGPKTDRWLVQTVGALVTVIGAVIGLAGSRRRLTPEVELLAVGSALSLAAVDVVFVARRRIRPIYLLDALTNLLIVGGWIRARRPDPRPPPVNVHAQPSSRTGRSSRSPSSAAGGSGC